MPKLLAKINLVYFHFVQDDNQLINTIIKRL